MSSLKATWRNLSHLPLLPRSSHTLTTIGTSLHLFSGEHTPRVPLGSELHVLSLNPSIPIAITILASPLGPTPRVGAASASLENTLYLFGGRGGPEMAPLEEGGRVWSFEAGAQAWTALDPADETAPFPEARSYHAAEATDGKFYIHAGCPASGRLGDLWAFDVAARRWEKLKDAPGDPRGGTSIAVFEKREIWRFGGFNGSVEIGGVIDVYDISSDTWRSISYDLDHGPAARSVSCLVCVAHPRGMYLVTAFGESGPSTRGHAGAGKFLDDVWAYDIQNGEWVEVVVEGEKPEARGWFAVDGIWGEGVKVGMVLQGGLSEENTRLGDWWVLWFDDILGGRGG